MSFTAQLTDRSVIRVDGVDAIAFLNGLISQNVAKVTVEQPLYGCLLTPQGKYFADFFILLDGDAVLLDIASERVEATIQRLKMFVLRSKVTVTNASDQYFIYAVWGGESHAGYADPRLPQFGRRILATETVPTNATLTDYHAWRIQNGLADAADFELERTALLEANLDLLHGIAWDKGCYMGQELTARTHYRGLVKKRLLPFHFYDSAPLMDTPLYAGDSVIGHTRSTAGHYGLAFIKVENHDALFSGELRITMHGQLIEVIKPDWIATKSDFV